MGKALKKYNIPRNRVVILTKCFFGVDDEGNFPPISASGSNDGGFVNRVGLSRKHIFDAVEASVQRLGTYIDVLQIHRLDRETPREEIMKALNDVVESGKVRYIGASSVRATIANVRHDRSQCKLILLRVRWLRGNSKPCRTLPPGTAGTSLSQCRTITISLRARKSVR